MGHFDDYYIPTVRQDALDAIASGYHDSRHNWDDLICAICDDDSVTGGTCGSYFNDASKAAAHVRELFWDPSFDRALYEMDRTMDEFISDCAENGPEKADVLARQCALYDSESEIRAAWVERQAILAEDRAISWKDLAETILSWPDDLQDMKARVYLPGKCNEDEFPLVSSVDQFDTTCPASRENFYSLNLIEY